MNENTEATNSGSVEGMNVVTAGLLTYTIVH